MRFKFLWSLIILLVLTWMVPFNKTSNSQISTQMGITLIDEYKKNIAPLNVLKCSYYPSCSQYTRQAIEKYGFVHGCLLGCDRLMRCNNDLWVYPEVKVDGELKKYNPVP